MFIKSFKVYEKMIHMGETIAFGPVPSRRLGKSLGMNNIPPKNCTYSCIYCQLGRTNNMQVERKKFYGPQEILNVVKNKVRGTGEKFIDYLTFVPDGEPTLDINLGEEIDLLKPLGIKIGVITNASLMWKEDVRNELCKADWVSVKIDAVNLNVWRKIDRPHGSLDLSKILDGISSFSYTFDGDLVTETMLVHGVNSDAKELEKVANVISKLNLKKSYISVPIRPPAEKWVKPANGYEINLAYQIFKERGLYVEYLVGYEGNAFSSTGNLREDILSITAVHPIREEGINELLNKTGESWDLIEELLDEKEIIEIEYKNKKFYLRNLQKDEINKS